MLSLECAECGEVKELPRSRGKWMKLDVLRGWEISDDEVPIVLCTLCAYVEESRDRREAEEEIRLARQGSLIGFDDVSNYIDQTLQAIVRLDSQSHGEDLRPSLERLRSTAQDAVDLREQRAQARIAAAEQQMRREVRAREVRLTPGIDQYQVETPVHTGSYTISAIPSGDTMTTMTALGVIRDAIDHWTYAPGDTITDVSES